MLQELNIFYIVHSVHMPSIVVGPFRERDPCSAVLLKVSSLFSPNQKRFSFLENFSSANVKMMHVHRLEKLWGKFLMCDFGLNKMK